MRKLNNFEKGISKNVVIESFTRRDKVTKNDEANIIKINCLYHHFDNNDKLIKVTKLCTKCKKEFTLKYLQYVYSWCADCMNKSSLNARKNITSLRKGFKLKDCLICKKQFKTKGNYICPVCTEKINNTYVPKTYRASCC